ncbi:Dps family protein, partial [Phenylobacterium sp.]
SSIKDGDPEGDSQAMLQALTADHETVIATCRDALALAQKADDEASAGIITDRLEAHEKHAWMLRATLGGK